jgi:hypothetical protein
MIWSEGSLMAPNSRNDDGYQFARTKSTWKQNLAQIGGLLYFGGHFGFKMASIANHNGCHIVQYVLVPVNIHLHWNLFIFEFLTIYFDFILAAILKILNQWAQLWVMIYFCVKFQKDPLYGVNLTFFAPWLPWQWTPFWIFSSTQKLPHTTVDIPAKFHEVWWKE